VNATMRTTKTGLWTGVLAAAVAGTLLMLPQGALGVAGSWGAAGRAQSEDGAASRLAARLGGKQFKNVKVSVADGMATLTGTVALYEDKEDAGNRARHTKGITAVRNDIQVAGAEVSDAQLEKKLGEELAYNREGYGNVFDAIGLKVEDGVVTLGGHAHDYPNRDAAVALAATTPGVKDVIDEIEVDPVSSIDWRIRTAVARAIYDYPTFTKYAINPARPIRISVQNGHVELYGTVDSASDKNIAFLRANSVPGVFSVKNYLQVQGQPSREGPQ